MRNQQYLSSFNNYFNGEFFVDKKVNPELELIWNSSTYGSYSNTTFTLLDTLLIVPDLGGRVTAFHTETGKKIGEIKYSGEIAQSVIVYKSTLIFIVNESRKKTSQFVIYDLKRGKELKSIELQGKFNTELLLIGKNTIAISDFGMIYKISTSGEIIWKKKLNKNIYSNPATDGKTIFTVSAHGFLTSINLENGEINFDKKIAKGFESGIAIDNGNLFFGDIEGNFYSLYKTSGKIIWKTQTSSKIIAAPGLDKQNIYFGNLNGDFYCLNKNTGGINWKIATGGVINTSPLIFRNIILQPNLKKRLYIIDKEKKTIVNSIEYDGRCKTTPVYFNNQLYIGVDKGEIFCYKITQ